MNLRSHKRPAVVIGGGWAGLAAAFGLASRGIPVVLHEVAPQLGGRARRVERAGLPIDNGQHMLVGAYEATRTLLWAVHGKRVDAGLRRQRLAIRAFAPGASAVEMQAPALRPPWNLAGALALAKGPTVVERITALRWLKRLRDEGFARPDGETVDAMLAALPERIARGVFAPLALAALNTPTDHGSSQVFAHLLDLISRRAGDADYLVPAFDLSELMPDPCARRIEARNGEVRLRSSAQVAAVRDDGIDVLAGGGIVNASAVIVAVGPHQLANAFSAEAAALPGVADAIAATSAMRFEPTATIYLGFRERVRLGDRIQRLDDAPGQWVFDRNDVLARARDAAATHMLGGLLAVVISASGVHDDLDAKALAGRVHAQLRRLRPSVPMPVWSQVIVERRSTFACVPGLRRPSAALAPRLHLAGDYLDASLPATLEASVASGEAAARVVARAFQSETRSASR